MVGVGTRSGALSYNAMQIGIYGLFGVAMGASRDNLSLEWQWYTGASSLSA